MEFCASIYVFRCLIEGMVQKSETRFRCFRACSSCLRRISLKKTSNPRILFVPSIFDSLEFVLAFISLFPLGCEAYDRCH